MNMVSLTTPRLMLRPLGLGDLDRMEELSGNYEVSKMLSRVPYPYERDRGEAYLKLAEAALANWPSSGQMDFAICREGELVGAIVLRELQGTPGIGYWLGQPYWGKGYMSEALTRVLAWVFAELNLTTMRAEVMKDNPASRALLERLGFNVVGEGASMSLARGKAADDWHLEVTRQDFEASAHRG